MAADPGLWHGLAPRRGSLPREAAEALDGIAAHRIEPALATLAQVDAPAHPKALVIDALKSQAAGMRLLARAILSNDPQISIRLSRQAASQLQASAHMLRAAGLPKTGGA